MHIHTHIYLYIYLCVCNYVWPVFVSYQSDQKYKWNYAHAFIAWVVFIVTIFVRNLFNKIYSLRLVNCRHFKLCPLFVQVFRYCMKSFSISYTNWERTNFYYRPWRPRGKNVLQSCWTNTSIFSNRKRSVFSQIWTFYIRIRWWTHKTTVDFLYSHKMYRYWSKSNTKFTLWFWRVFTSDGDIMLPFIFLYGSRLNTNRSDLLYFKIFTCNFGKYTW